MKLNLGCGTKIKEGFVNIDLYPQSKEVIKGSIDKLDYPDNSIEEIHSDMSLEHMGYVDTPRILKEWNRVLIPCGSVWIRTMNLDGLCKDWMEKKFNYTGNLKGFYGSQTDEGQYHKTSFDFNYLKGLLEDAGFVEVAEETPDHPHHLIVTAKNEKPQHKEILEQSI